MTSSNRTHKTVLLTGATGFLGSHLLEALLSEGYEVIALKRSTSDTWRIEHLLKRAKFIDIDIDPIDRAFQLNPVDAVLHTACLYGRNNEKATTVSTSNVLFPLSLLELSVAYQVPRFVSCDTFYSKFFNAYSLTKNHFRDWLCYFSKHIQVANLILQHVYGPHDSDHKFVPWVLQQMLKETATIPLTEGIQKRDFIYIDDVVTAFMHVLTAPGTPGFASYDLGTGKLTRLRDFLELARIEVEQQLGRKIKTELAFGQVPYRPGEIMAPKINPTPLMASGWQPQIGVEEGLRKTIGNLLGGNS